jgi:N-acetylglucosaminyl-diphospho-decaprenol L-rhamnosyltransferase
MERQEVVPPPPPDGPDRSSPRVADGVTGAATGGGIEVSVVVPSYNAAAFLESCLDSIYRQPPQRAFEVLVVNDASNDETSEMVRRRFPAVRMLVNERNLGYARSSNRGIEAARGRFIYLLNSDVEVLPGAIDTLVDFLERHDDAGAAASLLYNGDGSVQQSVKALPSFRSAVFGARSWITRFWPSNRFTRHELLHWRAAEGEPFTAGYVSSASLMVGRDLFRRIGELDSRFFYFLDADLCKRIWDANGKVFCVPAAGAVHHAHQGGSLASIGRRLRAVENFHRGAYRYYRKHGGKPLWHPMTPVVALSLGMRFVLSGLGQLLREATGRERKLLEQGRPLSEDEKNSFRPKQR